MAIDAKQVFDCHWKTKPRSLEHKNFFSTREKLTSLGHHGVAAGSHRNVNECVPASSILKGENHPSWRMLESDVSWMEELNTSVST